MRDLTKFALCEMTYLQWQIQFPEIWLASASLLLHLISVELLMSLRQRDTHPHLRVVQLLIAHFAYRAVPARELNTVVMVADLLQEFPQTQKLIRDRKGKIRTVVCNSTNIAHCN